MSGLAPEGAGGAFAFTMKRSRDVMGWEFVSTRETVHGLLRFEGDALHIQWRLARSTERVGWQVRTDREIEPVREAVVPLRAIAGATVRWIWLRWPPGRYLVITGSDLKAFEELAGPVALQLDHPAELVLRVSGREWLAAREFAGDLELAIADRAVAAAEARKPLPEAAQDSR